MNLGENIYRLRTEKNMSQGDLADALEVSRQSVSKWENNSAVPELDKLVKMAQIFGVSIDELVNGTATPAPPPEPELIRAEPQKTVYPPVEIRPRSIPVLSVVGIVLLFLSILSLILFLIFGEDHWFLYDCIFYISLPLCIASIFCLLPGKKQRKTFAICLVCLLGLVAAFWLLVHMPSIFAEVFTTTTETPAVPGGAPTEVVFPSDGVAPPVTE